MRDARRQREVDVGFGQPAPRDAPARQAVGRYGGDGLDFIGAHRRGPDLDLIDAGRGELPRDRELLACGEGDARRLLAVAQRRIIDKDAGRFGRHRTPHA